MYKISDNSVIKRAQEPQNTENWDYPYMGTIRKNGPIFIIFSGDICYPIRTQSTKFQRIRLKNTLKNLKIPKIGGILIWELCLNVNQYSPSSNLTCLQTKDDSVQNFGVLSQFV